MLKKGRRAKFKLVHEGRTRASRGVDCGKPLKAIQRDLRNGKNRRKGMSGARAWLITIRAKLLNKGVG